MAKVTKDMGILEIVQQHPEAIEVFQKYGMGCLTTGIEFTAFFIFIHSPPYLLFHQS